MSLTDSAIVFHLNLEDLFLTKSESSGAREYNVCYYYESCLTILFDISRPQM